MQSRQCCLTWMERCSIIKGQHCAGFRASSTVWVGLLVMIWLRPGSPLRIGMYRRGRLDIAPGKSSAADGYRTSFPWLMVRPSLTAQTSLTNYSRHIFIFMDRLGVLSLTPVVRCRLCKGLGMSLGCLLMGSMSSS